MFLSKLEILGFKSFARKTVFQFPTGITTIVGPNGCGKTNVVDAIRWVLGEQRAGAIRSERMENVIFNGSASTPPLGMAEVSITFENTKNILPVEYSEVTVSRRLFRSGESQYLLNNTPCRLKDIQDLFLDTGLAPDAYSVIELSMVESILNGKYDERRRVLEEAAGVGKYKVRRKATFRKLEATQADLLRLDDLISEIERNVRSLQSQVRKAHRLRELQERLREKDLLLSGLRLQNYQDELQPLAEELEKLKQRREYLQTQIDLEEAEEEALRAKLLDAETDVAEAQRVANQRAEEARRLEERLLVLRERKRSAKAVIKRINGELAELEMRNRRLSEEKEATKRRIGTADKRAVEVERKFQKATEERQAILQRRDQSRNALKQMDAGHRQLQEEWNRVSIEYERIRAAVASRKAERDRARQESQLLQEQAEEVEKRLQSLQEDRGALQARLSIYREQQRQRSSGRDKIKQRVEALRDDEIQITAELEKTRQHIQALRNLIETYEDRPDAVQAVFSDETMRGKVRGTVADFISVPSEVANAVLAVLRDAAHYLVVENTDSALKGISLLQTKKKGTASFLPLKEIRSSSLNRAEAKGEGVVGWADELVRSEPWFQPIVKSLLGNVLIVEDWVTATTVRDRFDRLDHFTVVTKDGTVLRGSGVVSGGSVVKTANQLFNRQAQLRELERTAQILESSLRKHTEIRQKEEQNLRRAENDLEKVAAELNETAAQLHRKEIESNQLNVRLDQIQNQIKELTQIIRGTPDQEDLDSRLAELTRERESLDDRISQIAADLQTTRGQNERLENNAQVSEDSYQQVRYEMLRVRAELENLEKQLERLEQESVEVEQFQNRRLAEKEETERLLEQTEAAIATLERDLEKALVRKEQADENAESAHRTYAARNTELNQQRAKIRALREESDSASESTHSLELQTSELRLNIENLRTRVTETWDVQLEVSDTSGLSAAQLQTEVARIRDRIERMGAVNLLAIEEYEKEKQRLDFLRSQREDLLQAKDNLLKTIDQINHTARERFLETFEQVRKSFTMVFQSFFQGGEADLRLSDPSDPLESNIEILARPRGKKVETLSLLSGGEKALTAISFLFAIYLVKPSPFCFLDEIDAPLDDNNVESFIQAVRKFSDNTQFIIVTHNKLTMHAADALYGVTMQRDGVSKVVSVKFEEDTVPEPVLAPGQA